MQQQCVFGCFSSLVNSPVGSTSQIPISILTFKGLTVTAVGTSRGCQRIAPVCTIGERAVQRVKRMTQSKKNSTRIQLGHGRVSSYVNGLCKKSLITRERQDHCNHLANLPILLHKSSEI